jgi:predicted nucleic acid-binding protein
MSYLLDTGVLLRLVDNRDAQHPLIRAAVRELIRRADDLVITTQNIAEFSNVATRPVANNGLGLPPASAVELLTRDIEPLCSVLPEKGTLPAEFKRLLTQYNVVGK